MQQNLECLTVERELPEVKDKESKLQVLNNNLIYFLTWRISDSITDMLVQEKINEFILLTTIFINLNLFEQNKNAPTQQDLLKIKPWLVKYRNAWILKYELPRIMNEVSGIMNETQKHIINNIELSCELLICAYQFNLWKLIEPVKHMIYPVACNIITGTLGFITSYVERSITDRTVERNIVYMLVLYLLMCNKKNKGKKESFQHKSEKHNSFQSMISCCKKQNNINILS